MRIFVPVTEHVADSADSFPVYMTLNQESTRPEVIASVVGSIKTAQAPSIIVQHVELTTGTAPTYEVVVKEYSK